MKNFFKVSLLFFVSLLLLLGVISAVEVSDNDTVIVKESGHSIASDSVSSKMIVKNDKSSLVKSASGKVKTRLTIDHIPTVSKDSGVLVSGRLCDVNGKGISNARVTLDVNGDKRDTTTYDGDYFGEYLPSKSGKHIVRVTFKGNSKYLASSAVTSFNVSGKIGTYIDLKNVNDLKYGDTARISGYFSSYSGNYLKNSWLTVSLNGKNYTAKTNDKGYFVRDVKVNKLGKNTVKVLFKGNSKYKWASSYDSFTVSRQSTKITCNSINSVNKSAVVKVSGRLVDAHNTALKYVNVVVKVNGVAHNVKTDVNGYYSYSFKASKVGSNSVSVSYSGNKYFLGKSVSRSFNVKSPYKSVTLYMDQVKIIGNDRFSAWYQTVNGEFDRGVYVLVNNYYQGLDGFPDNKIVSATFYYKNRKGNVISRTFDEGNGFWMKHELINGYTPVKVVANYNRMSSYETHMWNSLYRWDAKTDTWHYYGD